MEESALVYNREKAVAYAHKWAYSRNPAYLDFEGIGGDCTNFTSQCLYAGGCPMNFTPTFGWYYISSYDRAAAWTGVQYFYNFAISNDSRGPYAQEVGIEDILPGDIIQLSFNPGIFSHSLLVVEVGKPRSPSNVLLSTHSFDSDNRPLSSYSFMDIRYLKINARG